MASSIEHRAAFAAPVDTVYSALVDKSFLEDRLQALGGKGAALLEHTVTGDVVSYRLRMGLDGERLPSAVRAILRGDLVVERAERWQPEGAVRASAMTASMNGVPAQITGASRITEAAPGASELLLTARAKVNLPLVGGKLESVIAEQVGRLLAAEAEFAATWIAEHRG